MNSPFPIVVCFDGENPAPGDAVAGVPELPGVYCLYPRTGEAHAGSSRNLRRRVRRLFDSFGSRIAAVECWPSASRLDSLLILYAVTRKLYPADYMRRLRLRPPWFAILRESDSYPDLIAANRLGSAEDFVLGPFGSRDAVQAYEEKVLTLFQVRRCPGSLEPAPDHPGCVYGEMNQCLRPCQLAVSRDEYASEVRRLREFLETNGRNVLRTLSLAREQASERMDFEEAAHIHKRAEKVKSATALRDDVALPVRTFCGVALTPGFDAFSCVLRPMWNGCWQESVTVTLSRDNTERRSLDAEIREHLGQILRSPSNSGNILDHLAIFQRWFRSSYRDGEWFPFTRLENLEYRRIVRAMSKLVTLRAPADATGHAQPHFPSEVSC